MPDSGYDYQPNGRRQIRRAARHAAPYAGRAVVLSLAVAALVFVLLRLGGPAAPDRDPGQTRGITAAEPSPTQAGNRSATVSPDAADPGGDAAELDALAADAKRTVRTFLTGWLTRDNPDRRARLLKASATRALAAGLARTSPEQIPAGPVRAVRLVGASATSAEFTATLPDVSVRIIVAADPEARSGWRVVSIEQAGG